MAPPGPNVEPKNVERHIRSAQSRAAFKKFSKVSNVDEDFGDENYYLKSEGFKDFIPVKKQTKF